MRAGPSPSPAGSAGVLRWSTVLLAMVVFHLMTHSPSLPPPGIDPPDKGGGGSGRWHNTSRCDRLLELRDGRYYCDAYGCKRFVPDDEIADTDPLDA